VLTARLLTAADKDNDGTVSRPEWTAVADDWFQKLDTGNTGKVTRADFVAHFNSLLPPPNTRLGLEPKPVLQWPEFNTLIGGYFNSLLPPPNPRLLNLEAKPVQQWPEFNTLIGGYFKFHWPDPQLIYVKIDDPKSPLTAMFHGKEFEIHDETYTFEQESFSRRNVHVLTSIDYDQMSAEDKAKEARPRSDADYALSYIRREGKGRVFYEGHGHSDRVYAMTPMLEHLRAGIQYALGDLKADDSPSVK
jgi:hypothetical protein